MEVAKDQSLTLIIIRALVVKDFIVVIVNHQSHPYIGLYLTNKVNTTFIPNKTKDRFNFIKVTIILDKISMSALDVKKGWS
jgi:hypothetical protein